VKTIPAETVEKVWATMKQWTSANVTATMDRLAREQPAAVGYLMAKDEEIFGEQLRGKLLLLGALAFETFRAAGLRCKPVTLDELETAEEQNIRLLEQLDEGSESDWVNSVQAMLANYEQMPLLGTVLEILMEDKAEAPELVADAVGQSLLHVKAVVDCLHRRSHANSR